MKFIAILLFASLVFSCQSTEAPLPPEAAVAGATLSGQVVNGPDEFITLQYTPRLRGNLNPDGFRTLGTRTDSEGRFSFAVDKVTTGGTYSLILEDNWLHFALFPGDKLELSLDSDDPDAAFVATGRGAGQINFQRLEQWQFDYGYILQAETPAAFAARADSVFAPGLRMLEAVYAGNPDVELVATAANRAEIQRLMTETPLSAESYAHLQQELRYLRYYMTDAWLNNMSQRPEQQEVAIDFNSAAFAPFDPATYQSLTHMNNMRLANGLDAVLRIEQLKDIAMRADSAVTYGNWFNHLRNDPADWQLDYLQEHFSDEVYQSHVGEMASWMMSMGGDYPLYTERFQSEPRGPYGDRVTEFTRLLNRGTRQEAGFEADSLALDKQELQALLERYSGKDLLINFWSAQFAGSSIVDKIPLLQDFEGRNRADLAMVNVCIDSLKHKNLWAARILDSDWKGAHYFIPIENSEGLLKDFSDRDLNTFCEGGANYALIDAAGEIHGDIESPFYKVAKVISRELAP